MAKLPIDSRKPHRKPSPIVIDGDRAIVTLTKGFVAIIDAADVGQVSGFRWAAMVNKRCGNAYAYKQTGCKTLSMHRMLMDSPSGVHVDHINGDGLDNRRGNLRLATCAQNQANSVLARNNRLGLKGVYESKGKFRASIKPGGRTIHLGQYVTKAEAAAAYKGAAIALWGDYAKR